MYRKGHDKNFISIANILSSNSILQARALQFAMSVSMNARRDAEALEKIAANGAATMLLRHIQDTKDLNPRQASTMLLPQ